MAKQIASLGRPDEEHLSLAAVMTSFPRKMTLFISSYKQTKNCVMNPSVMSFLMALFETRDSIFRLLYLISS